MDLTQDQFEQLKAGQRYVTVDLVRADLNPDRADFDGYVKASVADAVTSGSADRFRDLWKAIIVEAARRFSWRPTDVPVRKISQSPSTDALVRHATRVIAMVHELHKAGYQRIRMLPYLAPSGCYWRCAITFADNIADDGFNIVDEDYDRRLVAPYTTGDENRYFGWNGAATMSARELAARFIQEFPLIAERGAGRDWMYAGWVTDVLGRAEQGRQEDLLFLLADFDLDGDVLRDWQPPPPSR